MGNRSAWPESTIILINGASLILIVAGVRAAADLIVPFLLALFLAVIIIPKIDRLTTWGIPRWLAVGLVTLIVSLILALGLAYVGVSLNELLWRLPEIQQKLYTLRENAFEKIKAMGIPIASDRADMTIFDPAYGVRLLGGLLSGLSNIFSNGLVILITVAFVLLESGGFPAKIRSILGAESPAMIRSLKILTDQRRYMVIKSWISLATGVPVAIGLALMGIDYAILWGVLAFFLNFIPNIGSLIAAIPPVVLALVQNGAPVAVGVVLLFVVINFVIGYLVEPPAMGKGLGLSTLVVWISLVFWGWVLGPVGMFLSVPLTMTLKIILEGSDETRWLAILLGPGVKSEIDSEQPPS